MHVWQRHRRLGCRWAGGGQVAGPLDWGACGLPMAARWLWDEQHVQVWQQWRLPVGCRWAAVVHMHACVHACAAPHARKAPPDSP